jgi:uncharacterized protein (TIGR03435 family)
MRKLATWTCLLLTPALALSQTNIAQQAPMPKWQIEAGPKQQFEVASIRQNQTRDQPSSNVPLTVGASYSTTGGVFSAKNASLLAYILFAYKIPVNELHDQLRSWPQWVITDRFDIQAKSENRNPNKDQMRLMMQSLLEHRFKLVVHREVKPTQIFSVSLAKPDKTGPQLQPHSTESPCQPISPTGFSHPSNAISDSAPSLLGKWPTACAEGDELWSQRRVRAGGRDMSMEEITAWLTGAGDLDLLLQNHTGLKGNYDFIIDFGPEPDPSNNNTSPDSTQPSFREALKDQLGLLIKKEQGSAVFFIIDNVEHPSEN